MMKNKFMLIVVYLINMTCCAIGKFFLINIKEENLDFGVEQSENDFYKWKELEDNGIVSLGAAEARRTCGPECKWTYCNGRTDCMC